MDDIRAKELLTRERERLEEALARLEGDGPLEGTDREEPGDRDTEDLYQDEFDAGRARDLENQLQAVARAEERLADGTYGLSIESGEPIPDKRLEAVPTAERTVAEQEQYERG